MTIAPTLFVPALLLLLFPVDRLLSRRVELRDFESFHTLGGRERFRHWWREVMLWVDPARGFIGASLLSSSLGLSYGRWDVPPHAEHIVAITTVAAGVLAQLITRRERGVLLAPLGFVLGIVSAIAPWYVTAIAATMAIAALFGFRNFHAFFVAGFAAVMFLAFISNRGHGWVGPTLAAFGIPVIAGVVTGRGLETPSRIPEDAHRHRKR